jgi:acetylornithine deacetylase/succinyl-diaminopimelate desuccinylase-like protein
MRGYIFDNIWKGQLFDLLKFETYKLDQKEACALFLKDLLISFGLEVKVFESAVAPIIVAKTPGECRKRILLYSHYDVKPPGDLSKWNTNPFEPIIKNDRVYCRGSGDAKGQLFIAMKVAEIFLKENRENNNIGLTLLFEGEEETGSCYLNDLCNEQLEYLKCEMVLILDSHWYFDKPIISYGTRGQISLYLKTTESEMSGPLHAGNYGGIYQGANYRMIKALAGCLEGKFVNIPGFYDEVLEKKNDQFGASFTVCAIEGGDMDRSLVPQSCIAHIDIRIVLNQNPEHVAELIRDYFFRKQIDVELRQISNPVLIKPDNLQLDMLKQALKSITYVDPIIIPYLGAYVPIEKFTGLKCPVYALPFAQSDENNHAPNENLRIHNILLGVECIYSFLKLYMSNKYLMTKNKGGA